LRESDHTSAKSANAPANAAAGAIGLCVEAALVDAWSGADEVVFVEAVEVVLLLAGEVVRVVAIVVGAIVVSYTVPPLEVAVRYDGYVTYAVLASLVSRVIGIHTVAFVVGGSVVMVLMYSDVRIMVLVKVSVYTTVYKTFQKLTNV